MSRARRPSSAAGAAPRPGGFVRTMTAEPSADTGRYRFTLPAVQSVIQAGGLELAPRVTFLVGDNGTSKSTLVEALAVAAGSSSAAAPLDTARTANPLTPVARLGVPSSGCVVDVRLEPTHP